MDSEVNEFRFPPMPPMPRISFPPNVGRSRLHRREHISVPSRLPSHNFAPCVAQVSPGCLESGSTPSALSPPELHRRGIGTSPLSSSESSTAVSISTVQNEGIARECFSAAAIQVIPPPVYASATGLPSSTLQSSGTDSCSIASDESKNRFESATKLEVGTVPRGKGGGSGDGAAGRKCGTVAKQSPLCFPENRQNKIDSIGVANIESNQESSSAMAQAFESPNIEDSSAESAVTEIEHTRSSNQDLDVIERSTKIDSQLPQTSSGELRLYMEQSHSGAVDLLPSIESDLEEGQLPGEWSGSDDTVGDQTSLQAPLGADSLYAKFTQIKGVAKSCRKKHAKGEGSRKRSREKAKEKYKGVLKRRKAERNELSLMSNKGGDGGKENTPRPGQRNGKVENFETKTVPEANFTTDSNMSERKNTAGSREILAEPKASKMGLLSLLVEEEVGLWTKDEVDDEMVAELKAGETKKRGPETAERKLKRKIAKRKKRAEKERELGIRRPPRVIPSKPVKVLCTHYMKGRCSKGGQCPFSHDAVPLTKQEPCKFLMNNSCLKGDDCPYSHNLQAFPCKFFHTRGLCFDGLKCQFSHAAISEEELEKLRQRVEKEKKDRAGGLTQSTPAPRFSSPLPPELDPDPLGWGTSSNPGYTHLQHSVVPQKQSTVIMDQRLEQSLATTPLMTANPSQWTNTRSSAIGEANLTCSGLFSKPLQIGKKPGDLSLYDNAAKFGVESVLATSGAVSMFPLSPRGSGCTTAPVSPYPTNDSRSAKASLEVSLMTEGLGPQTREMPDLSSYPVMVPARARGRALATEKGVQQSFRQRAASIEKFLNCHTKASPDGQKAVDNIIQEVLNLPTPSIFDVTECFDHLP